MMAMFQNSQTISGAGLAVVCLVSSGCFPFYPEVFYPEDFRVTPEHEIVMKAGDVLHAKTRNGSITITAGPETERTFRWQGCEWRLKLFARPAPFQGRFGIYRPGDNRLPTCRGLYRINAEECHWHFDSVDQVLEKLNNSYWKDYLGSVWTHDGLVVGMGETPERRQFDVEVRQILVRGKKPVGLPGASDSRIALGVP
jgi:hypothetical protein